MDRNASAKLICYQSHTVRRKRPSGHVWTGTISRNCAGSRRSIFFPVLSQHALLYNVGNCIVQLAWSNLPRLMTAWDSHRPGTAQTGNTSPMLRKGAAESPSVKLASPEMSRESPLPRVSPVTFFYTCYTTCCQMSPKVLRM